MLNDTVDTIACTQAFLFLQFTDIIYFVEQTDDMLHEYSLRGKKIVVAGCLNINILRQDSVHRGHLVTSIQRLLFCPQLPNQLASFQQRLRRDLLPCSIKCGFIS